MKKLTAFILFLLLTIICCSNSSFAEDVNGEVSIGVKGIKFKDIEGTKPLTEFVFGNRWNNLGVMLSIGVTNIDSARYDKNGITYLEEINYYPVELNLKGFMPLRRAEVGAGIGVSMNYLSFSVTNELTNKDVQSNTNLLFGVQGLAEIKFLFPSTAGKDAFVGVDAEYQYIGKTNTFLGAKDLTNYRLGIKLGGRF